VTTSYVGATCVLVPVLPVSLQAYKHLLEQV